MALCDDYKIIFIHIPKNAGTSIISMLPHDRHDGHHKLTYYKYKYPKKWKSYKKFCIVRNSWERVVSCYEYAKMEKSYWHSSDGKNTFGKHDDYDLLRNKTFKECVLLLRDNPKLFKHPCWEEQYTYICDKDGTINKEIDIINLENLNNDIYKYFPTSSSLVQLNKSNTKKYYQYYDDETIEIIRKIYTKDINYFSFKFSHLKE